jgi:hypothetical protein
MPKLNQIIAIEKGEKTKLYNEFTELYKTSQKVALFNGFSKTYTPKDDEGELFPSENMKVQVKADDLLNKAENLLTELFDITAAKDYANCNAKADVVVNGNVLIKDVPTTYLLFLEKQCNDIEKFIATIPVLDESDNWDKDDNSNLYKTQPTLTHRTKKTQKPLVLFPATDKHPAQTQLVSEDVLVGYWNMVKLSGALPVPRKNELLSKVNELSKAVKFAREQANLIDAEKHEIGKKVFEYLFS